LEKQVFNKMKMDENLQFIKLPSNIRHYVNLADFKAEMMFLYALIVNYYDADLGYAFPSQDTLAIDYGKTPKTVRQHLSVLKKYELIQMGYIDKKAIYRPLLPLDDKTFFSKYPSAWKNYQAAIKKRDEERVKDNARLIKWRTENSVETE